MNHAHPTFPAAYRPWLHRYALLLVITTFILLVAGGNVTSHNAGLAVPDWPTTLGQNMFTYPLWKLNRLQLDEHTHRLIGALVGFLCIGMTAALWLTQKNRRWLQWTGVVLLVLVIVQGVMGGLRVTDLSTKLAIVHGITAQIFLCLTVWIAAATSRWWLGEGASAGSAASAGPPATKEKRPLAWLTALLVILLVQLSLGAAVRHEEAALAIPDFPSSYGHWLPPMNEKQLGADLKAMPPAPTAPPVTLRRVHLNFAHRAWAVVTVIFTLITLALVGKYAQGDGLILRPAWALVLMILVQVLLGASVIWSGREPWVATSHQAMGAVILGTTALLTLRVWVHRPRPAAAAAQPVATVRLTGGHA